jgi:hypothetical protein
LCFLLCASLHCYSLCFDVVMCFTTTCVSSLLLLHYSCYFAIVWCVIVPPRFIAFLPF